MEGLNWNQNLLLNWGASKNVLSSKNLKVFLKTLGAEVSLIDECDDRCIKLQLSTEAGSKV
jgi:hypothetical protein